MYAFEPRSEPIVDRPRGRPTALLLCRDEQIRDLVARWLREAHYCVRHVRDGYDASALLTRCAVDLLILNGFYPRHPGQDGLLARKNNELQRVLLIPSSEDRPMVGIAKLYGIDAVLPRPLTRTAFLAALVAVQ